MSHPKTQSPTKGLRFLGMTPFNSIVKNDMHKSLFIVYGASIAPVGHFVIHNSQSPQVFKFGQSGIMAKSVIICPRNTQDP